MDSNTGQLNITNVRLQLVVADPAMLARVPASRRENYKPG
jgi:hypothetical protein